MANTVLCANTLRGTASTAPLPPLPVGSPRGSPEWQQWWKSYQAATCDDTLADGIFPPPHRPAEVAPLSPLDQAAADWRQLTLAHRRLLGGQPYQLPEPDPDLLAGLTAALLHPRSRAVLAELMIDVLAPWIGRLLADLLAEGDGEVADDQG